MGMYEKILALILIVVLISAGVYTLTESFTTRNNTNFYKSTTNEKILGLFLSFIFFTIAIAITFIIIKN